MHNVRYNVFVEGCIDKALFSWLARKAKIYLAVPPTMSGGWPNTIKLALEFVFKKKSTPINVLAVIDADKNIEERVRDIERLVHKYCNDRFYPSCYVENARLTDKPLLLKIIIRIPKVNRLFHLYVLFWCSLFNGCKSGTCEDIIWEMMNEKHGCTDSALYKNVCSSCPCGRFREHMRKIGLLAVLSACICRATVIAIGDKRCGIPITDILEELELEHTTIAEKYIKALKSIVV